MIGRQVKICTGFTQSIQILRRKKIKKIYCPMTDKVNLTIDVEKPHDLCSILFRDALLGPSAEDYLIHVKTHQYQRFL